MNEFLKQNWFKIIIAIVLLIMALSVAYYFVIFTPQKEQAIIEQQKQEQEAKDRAVQQAADEAAQAEAQKAAAAQAVAQQEAATQKAAAAQRAKQIQQNKTSLINCLQTAQDDFNANWAANCNDLYTKFKDSYDSCIKQGILSASECNQPYNYMDYSSDNCSLGTVRANSVTDTYTGEKDECYKLYPQN